MVIIYLLGGEDISRKDAKRVNERAFRDAGGAPEVLVFSWARASFDRDYALRKKVSEYFRFLGAGVVNFVEYSDSASVIQGKVECSDLVYFTGGLASVLVERLRNVGVDDLLHDYKGVIVGRSAGALALCKKMLITCRCGKIKIVDGLGLVDLTLKAHYKSRVDPILEQLSREQKIYAVPQGSALICNGNSASVVGNVFLFENGKKQELKSFS